MTFEGLLHPHCVTVPGPLPVIWRRGWRALYGCDVEGGHGWDLKSSFSVVKTSTGFSGPPQAFMRVCVHACARVQRSVHEAILCMTLKVTGLFRKSLGMDRQLWPHEGGRRIVRSPGVCGLTAHVKVTFLFHLPFPNTPRI